MATTSIWPINGSISHVIQYIGNPDKTTQAKFSDLDLQSLKDVMDYAVQTTKTEQQRFVSGVNCMPEIARQLRNAANLNHPRGAIEPLARGLRAT